MNSMNITSSGLGFWGPRTASVDWCEPNYVVSHYVAEWWNTLTSIPIALAGVWGLYFGYKYGYRARFLIPSFLMMLVGIGSVFFHGTLQYWGQALDELNMVYAVSACLFLSIENRPGPLKYKWLPIVLIIYNSLFTFVYLVLPTYFIFFVITFILECILVVTNSATMYHHTSDIRLKRMFWAGIGIYIAAFLFLWIPDNLFCDSVGWLYLHAWFHITGSIAPWWYINWAIFSFYLADYTSKTGMVIDSKTGKTSPASKEMLMHVYGVPFRVGRNGEKIESLTTSTMSSEGVPLGSRGQGASGILRNETLPPSIMMNPNRTTAAYGETDPEDTILIIPELHWLGARSVIMWPYVQLTRKIGYE